MRFGLFLLPCLLLLLFSATAQTTVSGRVLDTCGTPLAGVTILQRNTTHGVSSGLEGEFSLTVPGQLDSLALVVSSIGYVTQQLRVAADSDQIIRLPEDTKVISCYLGVAVPRAEFGLLSGVRYAPIGARLQLFGSRLLRLPLRATATYQTNLRRNHVASGSLALPSFNRRNWQLREQLDYQQLRAARLRFVSYTATAGFEQTLRNGRTLPALLLTGGFARLRPLLAADVAPTRPDLGYGLGLQHSFLPYPFHLQVRALATRWPGYWQWQGEINHAVRGYTVGVALHRLRQYQELNLTLSRSFY